MGVANQEFNRPCCSGHQPGSEEHDPRNHFLTSAKRAEERKHAKYDAICTATGSILSPFPLETTERAPSSSPRNFADSGPPADVLVGKLKMDISLALHRGTIAQVTTVSLTKRTVPTRATAPSYGGA